MGRIVFIVPGSRGDVQPYLALGKELKADGHFVRLVTHQNYEKLIEDNGLDFWPLEVRIEEIIQGKKMREVLENGRLISSMKHISGIMAQSAIRLAERSLAACMDMDLIMTGFSGLFITLTIAEKTGLPFLQAYNVPITPTREFPGALIPPLPFTLGGAFNQITHHITRQMLWQAYRPSDKKVRQAVFDLPPAGFWGPFGTDVLQKVPVLYGFSPAVIPYPEDWDANKVHITGYWNLEPEKSWGPPEDLVRFLDAGSPPVYIGFGSMSSRDPQVTADIVLAALKKSGQRGIVFSGWSGMDQDALPEDVLMIDSTPHAWLFPRMSAVVHHGGAGTTAAGLQAGVPTVIVPYHGDQPFWGARAAALGVGPEPIPRRVLTADRLARAMDRAVHDPEMRGRAKRLGEKISTENGLAETAVFVTDYIEKKR
jgi:UDP:flavonoid glycosyltransferase YjiC (YdhE family)